MTSEWKTVKYFFVVCDVESIMAPKWSTVAAANVVLIIFK